MKRLFSSASLLLLLAFAPAVSASTTVEIAETLMKVMSKGVKGAAASAPDEVSFLKKTPAFLTAAEKLSRNATPGEQKRLSALLESVLWAEYSAKGYSRATIQACPGCVSGPFADRINARAIDLIRQHDALLVKISAEPSQITRLVDSDGKPIPLGSDYQNVLNEIIRLFSPSIAAAKNEKSYSNFAKKFIQKLKENGAIEVEYDAKDEALTASFKFGFAKAKIAKLDASKMLTRLKYLLYGGGLTSLGYHSEDKDSAKESKSNVLIVSETESKRIQILSRLAPSDKSALLHQAEEEYILVKVSKLKAGKNK